MSVRPESLGLLRHLAGKPGHDEVKADFRQFLVTEFGVGVGEVAIELGIDALVARLVVLGEPRREP